jgi:hypothetical protein
VRDARLLEEQVREARSCTVCIVSQPIGGQGRGGVSVESLLLCDNGCVQTLLHTWLCQLRQRLDPPVARWFARRTCRLSPESTPTCTTCPLLLWNANSAAVSTQLKDVILLVLPLAESACVVDCVGTPLTTALDSCEHAVTRSSARLPHTPCAIVDCYVS